MNIKSFLDRYHNCPKCNQKLTLTINYNNSIIQKTDFDIKDDRISIRFFEGELKLKTNLKLSILFQTNSVILTPKMKKFIKFYGLDFYLIKNCNNCSYTINEGKDVGFFYSGKFFKDKFFELDLLSEGFTFIYNKEIYHLFNFFRIREGVILNGKSSYTTKIPIIPLDKFHFQNHKSVYKKIQDLLLLAG